MQRSGTASRQIIMRNARNVHGEIGGINSPNAQFADSMNFSKTNGISLRVGAYRAPESGLESERDNIIKVTILMDALLKRINYSRSIIAGSALYFGQTFWDFSRDTLRVSDNSRERQSQPSAISFKFSKSHCSYIFHPVMH